MTIDEAIKVFEKISSYDGVVDYLENYSVSVQDACFMAIKALKQYGVLQEIRQEILQVFANSSISNTDLSFGVLEIIDKHIKEIEG